jgi:hypothetical protein
MTADLGSLWGHTGPCMLPLSGHSSASTKTSRLPSASSFHTTSLQLTHLTFTCWFPAQHTFFPVFPRPAKLPSFRAIQNSVLPCWSAWWLCESPPVSFYPMASHWEVRSTLPFPSCFLHNLKFPVSQLFDFEDGGSMFLQNICLLSTDCMEILSNPTCFIWFYCKKKKKKKK